MIIKYENLVDETFTVFRNLINFIDKICNSKKKFDKKKAQNALNSTNFSKMKKIEFKKGFSESVTSNAGKNKIPFFFLGPENDFRKKLDMAFQEKLKITFQSNLQELKYL